jgi:hypothetical protein
MPALRGDAGKRQAGRSGTDYGNAPWHGSGQVVQAGFAAGARIDQAGDFLAAEDPVQAGLIAADAGVDFVLAAIARLDGEFRVGEKRAALTSSQLTEHLLLEIFGFLVCESILARCQIA